MGSLSETYRYIVRSAGVRSGNPIVQNTRIAVHDVIGLLQNGETIDTVTSNCFRQLTRSQVYASPTMRTTGGRSTYSSPGRWPR
jgi:uncharacterized protein (DUF433 family)